MRLNAFEITLLCEQLCLNNILGSGGLGISSIHFHFVVLFNKILQGVTNSEINSN